MSDHELLKAASMFFLATALTCVFACVGLAIGYAMSEWKGGNRE